MLEKVSSALVRLLSPVSIRPISSANPSNAGAVSTESNSKKEEFSKFEPEEAPQPLKTEETAPKPPSEPLESPRPGLTTAFLSLLARLQEHRLRFRSRNKPYGKRKGEKSIATLKKGMILDRET